MDKFSFAIEEVKKREKKAIIITWTLVLLPIAACVILYIVTKNKVDILNNDFKQTSTLLMVSKDSLRSLKQEYTHFDSIKRQLSDTIKEQKHKIFEANSNYNQLAIQNNILKDSVGSYNSQIRELDMEISGEVSAYNKIKQEYDSLNNRANALINSIKYLNNLITEKEKYLNDLKTASNVEQIQQIKRKYENPNSHYYKLQQQQQQQQYQIKTLTQQQQQQQRIP